MGARDRFSLIGHAEMPFMNPLTAAELVSLLDPLGLRPGDRTLDLGGGRADLSRLLAERYGCVATSVDGSAAATEQARARIAGLSVTAETHDARSYLALERPRGLALVSVVGAVHAFGDGLAGWTGAIEACAPCARGILLAELVGLGRRATKAFGVAAADDVETAVAASGATATAHRLGPDRVLAYERAWCKSLAAFLDAHPGDPREAWGRDRIAWTEQAELRTARAELEFRAYVLRARGSEPVRAPTHGL